MGFRVTAFEASRVPLRGWVFGILAFAAWRGLLGGLAATVFYWCGVFGFGSCADQLFWGVSSCLGHKAI